jgi:hypothetical protein
VRQYVQPFAGTALLLGILSGKKRIIQHPWQEHNKWEVSGLLGIKIWIFFLAFPFMDDVSFYLLKTQLMYRMLSLTFKILETPTCDNCKSWLKGVTPLLSYPPRTDTQNPQNSQKSIDPESLKCKVALSSNYF